MKKISKTEARKKIDEFFASVTSKSPAQIKKIKKLAMNHNIPLQEYRKTFCKKCFRPYIGPSIVVKKGFINITCDYCEYRARWKIV